MKSKVHYFLILFFLFIIPIWVDAQVTEVQGKITDATTGEPIPFASVVFTGTTIGTNSDFDGFYKISTSAPVDSITVSYIGYKLVTKKIIRGKKNTLNIQLQEEQFNLDEIVVKAGENPAHPIIRAAVANKDLNDPRKLISFEYESFTKIQLAVNNLSEKYKKNKVFEKVLPLFDTLSLFSDSGNVFVLPVFISETISDLYEINNPPKVREYIRASKVTGVGVEDGSVVSQLLGTTFTRYNFYKNRVNILDKEFVSPLSDAAFTFYKFNLKDSLPIDGRKCYRIQISPKVLGDLAFTGNIWIEDSTFAIKQLDIYVDRRVNINFIDNIKIQMQFDKTEVGPYLPVKTRISVDIEELTKNAPGMIAVYYNSAKKIKVNTNRPNSFYENPLEMAEDALTYDEDFWDSSRHEQITEEEKKVYNLVDSVRSLPAIKTYVEYVDIIVNGYKSIGNIDIGPYALVYGFNVLEGHRFRVGFRTNYKFSRKYILRAYTAYGTLDQRFKFGAQAEWIASRKKWTTLGIKYKDDVEQIGISDQNYGGSNLFTSLSIFRAAQLNRTLENTFWIESEVKKDWTPKISIRRKGYFFPTTENFNFYYYPELIEASNTGSTAVQQQGFWNSTISFDLRWAYQELFLQSDNERISLGTRYNTPIVNLNYTAGIKGFLDGDFNYHQASLQVTQRIPMGLFGTGHYIFNASKIFNPLPYPILQVQRGNQSLVASRSAYNLMNFFEFVTDQYISLNYEQKLEGILTNRIPAIKNWKLRMFAGFKGLWGSISAENLSLIPSNDPFGRRVSSFYQLNREPYVEISYGFENIFKLVRIEAIHRVTHRDNPGAIPFGVKASVNFTF